MATRTKKPAAKRTDAETVLHDYKRAIAGIVGDKFQLLPDALKELKTAGERESTLRLEVEHLMAQAVADASVTQQLYHALFELREWHKGEYHSSRRIDAEADAAIALFLEHETRSKGIAPGRGRRLRKP